MALVATVGANNANSYNTRAEAVAFFQLGNHPDSQIWATLKDEDQDQYQIQATTHIDMQRINGVKSDTTLTAGVPDQRLKFPRSVDNQDGSDYIHDAVKRAELYQAIHLAKMGSGSTTRQQLQAQGVESISIDGVSETYAKRSRSAESLLAPLALQELLAARIIVRGGRVAV